MKKTVPNIIQRYRLIPFEALMWVAALLYLFFIDPYRTQHYSLCLFKNLGIDFCPGCGIGRSISMIFHGDILHSLQMHPLGIFAVIIITARIIKLIINNTNQQQQKKGLKWQT